MRPGFAAYMPPSSVAPQQPPQQPQQQLQPLQQQQTQQQMQQQNQQRRKASGGDAAEQLHPGKPLEPVGRKSRQAQKQQPNGTMVDAATSLNATDASPGANQLVTGCGLPDLKASLVCSSM